MTKYIDAGKQCSMDRKINFGKYRGQEIKELILHHIGYIMWCIKNLPWFSLTEEEQAIYDALAIANVKYKIQFPFSEEDMLSCVANKDALRKLDTPFIVSRSGTVQFYAEQLNNPIIRSVFKYCTNHFPENDIQKMNIDLLVGMSHCLDKMPIEDFGEDEEVCFNDLVH